MSDTRPAPRPGPGTITATPDRAAPDRAVPDTATAGDPVAAGDPLAAGGPLPAVEGWFSLEGEPALLGTRCRSCGTVVFPPDARFCRNPHCRGTELEEVRLSRRGRVWSYTDARYAPPPPYVPRTDPFEPFALAAVALEAEGIVVLGQVADGYGVEDLAVGAPVELVIEPLFVEEGVERVTWRWRPVERAAGAAGPTGAGP